MALTNPYGDVPIFQDPASGQYYIDQNYVQHGVNQQELVPYSYQQFVPDDPYYWVGGIIGEPSGHYDTLNGMNPVQHIRYDPNLLKYSFDGLQPTTIAGKNYYNINPSVLANLTTDYSKLGDLIITPGDQNQNNGISSITRAGNVYQVYNDPSRIDRQENGVTSVPTWNINANGGMSPIVSDAYRSLLANDNGGSLGWVPMAMLAGAGLLTGGFGLLGGMGEAGAAAEMAPGDAIWGGLNGEPWISSGLPEATAGSGAGISNAEWLSANGIDPNFTGATLPDTTVNSWALTPEATQSGLQYGNINFAPQSITSMGPLSAGTGTAGLDINAGLSAQEQLLNQVGLGYGSSTSGLFPGATDAMLAADATLPTIDNVASNGMLDALGQTVTPYSLLTGGSNTPVWDKLRNFVSNPNGAKSLASALSAFGGHSPVGGSGGMAPSYDFGSGGMSNAVNSGAGSQSNMTLETPNLTNPSSTSQAIQSQPDHIGWVDMNPANMTFQMARSTWR